MGRLPYEEHLVQAREDEINWKRGVLVPDNGIVPSDRITNLDVHRG